MLLSRMSPFGPGKGHLPTRELFKMDRLIPVSFDPPLFSLDSTLKGLTCMELPSLHFMTMGYFCKVYFCSSAKSPLGVRRKESNREPVVEPDGLQLYVVDQGRLYCVYSIPNHI